MKKKKINFGNVDGVTDTSKITDIELGKCVTSDGQRRQPIGRDSEGMPEGHWTKEYQYVKRKEN